MERLGDRVLLSAFLFTDTTGGGGWNTPGNWESAPAGGDFAPTTALPGPSDDVGIPGGIAVTLSGTNAEVHSIVTETGSGLTITAGIELKIDSNPPTSGPAGMPLSPVPGSNYFADSVTIAGRVNANTTVGNNVLIDFDGPTTVGPGDLNGNLVSSAGSTITFTGGGGADTFLDGTTFGIGAGDIAIATTVSLGGALTDATATLDLQTGGALVGPGGLDDWSYVNWTGGLLAPAAGVTVEASYHLTISGSGDKRLETVLTNNSLTTSFGGSGTLFLGSGGAIVNSAGTIAVSLPMIANTGGATGGITNNDTFEGQAPADSPTRITVAFVNSGTLSVDNGAALTLAAPPGTPDTLNGSLQLNGTLYLINASSSTAGFRLLSGNGMLMIGDGTNAGSLSLSSGATATLSGTLEVSHTGLLTGAGQVNNGGTLQLDVGASTLGLGSYQESSMGTLAIQVASLTAFGQLSVAGLAQLSGNLKLIPLNGFVPSPGNSFTVVTAGSISAHFDSLPPNMTATYTSTSVTITQQ